MQNNRIEANQKLFEIAQSQQGYFTTTQAIDAGFEDNLHPYHVKMGNWIREYRGIYRLSRFPESEDSYLVLWSLWSRDRTGNTQGIYSHETALSLFELSDVNPAKLHMTVPPEFRRTAKIPDVIRLHKGIIQSKDCEERQGYKVLKPLPNILMLINDGTISDEIFTQVLKDGIEKGYLIKKQLLNLDVSSPDKQYLNKLLERI